MYVKSQTPIWTYGVPWFVVDQPFHETTPKRPVIDYLRTINQKTIKDLFLIDSMDEMVIKIVGKTFKSLIVVK